jgi:exonuclease VII large subunit
VTSPTREVIINKTPTALAEAIVDRFEKAQQELADATHRIEREWQYAISLQRQRKEAFKELEDLQQEQGK